MGWGWGWGSCESRAEDHLTYWFKGGFPEGVTPQDLKTRGGGQPTTFEKSGLLQLEYDGETGWNKGWKDSRALP